MARTVIDVAKEVLERTNEPLKPSRIYNIAKEMGLTKELGLSEKNPWHSFGPRIYMDV